jgi:tetratricopeptide (TPR) repeat protein
MTDDLYERYKEALRVGHVAVLRGALDEALAAYRTASSIAPSRALPHTSLGGVLLRLGHLEEALVEYAAAVARAPHDEGALLGQAEALTMAGQRVDAASALDHVSEIQEAAGRLPEAADTLRRALELHETPERARHQRGLLREIRLSAGDQAAEQLLARALRLRDEPAATPGETSWAGPAASSNVRLTVLPPDVPTFESVLGDEDEIIEVAAIAIQPADAARIDAEPVEREAAAWPIEPRASEPTPHLKKVRVVADWPAADLAQISPGAPAVEQAEAGEEQTPTAKEDELPEAVEAASAEEPEPAAAAAAEVAAGPAIPAELEPILAAVGVMEGAFDSDTPLGTVGESQHQPTGDELLAAAEAAEVSGDSTTLRSLLLWTARAYAREGRFEAGLDATHRLIQRAPGDVDAHLVLVELYVARDWNNLASEKLALLGRLAELNNDEPTRQRLCKVASRVFPKDERLASLCA